MILNEGVLDQMIRHPHYRYSFTVTISLLSLPLNAWFTRV